MQAQSVNTTRHPIHVSPEELVNKAISKAGRYNLGGLADRNQTRLTVALLKELRQAYITFPQDIRRALEDFLRG